jgi:putative phosphoesterase
MTTIGILSDTHITSCDSAFLQTVRDVFSECDIIIHAGDLTDHNILEAFNGKQVFAVHGNMCTSLTQKTLPTHREVIIEGYTFGICHGAGNRHNIEDRMFDLFPTADCIIYGHTHIAKCHKIGSTLMINPGSFQSTGRYGASGTYALLAISDTGLQACIYELGNTLIKQ